ncbi:hypothetical protein Tco_0257104 [Tanacetum coccineum]
MKTNTLSMCGKAPIYSPRNPNGVWTLSYGSGFACDAPEVQEDVQPGHVLRRMTELMKSKGMRYETIDGSSATDIHLHFKRHRRRVRQRTDGPSTSAQQT